MTQTAAFQAVLTGQLEKHGLAGSPVTAWVERGALALAGAKSGRVLIAPSRVMRMRIGYSESKSRRYHEAKLWLADTGERVTLHPIWGHMPAYGAVMRDFARAMEKAGALDRVERGDSIATALILPVLMGLLALAAIFISVVVLEDEPWWGRMIAPIVPVALTGFGIWLAAARHWPRPIRSLAELDKQLPP